MRRSDPTGSANNRALGASRSGRAGVDGLTAAGVRSIVAIVGGGSFRRRAFVLVGGALLGWLAFAITAWLPTGGLRDSSNCHTIADAGFDPWSGLGYGRVYECVRVNADAGNAVETVTGQDRPPRTRYGTRHALPIWVAVPIGWLAAAWLSRLQAESWLAGWRWAPRPFNIVLVVAGVILLIVACVGVAVTMST